MKQNNQTVSCPQCIKEKIDYGETCKLYADFSYEKLVIEDVIYCDLHGIQLLTKRRNGN
jgi:hypothetical protein